MLKAEIKVGESYLASGTGLGRAEVIAEPELDPYRSRRYNVKVNYPDAPPDTPETRKSQTIATGDIVRLWTPEDQQRFENRLLIAEEQRGWQEELQLAGYDGRVQIGADRSMRITFTGRAAERVLEILTGHEIPDEKKGMDE